MALKPGDLLRLLSDPTRLRSVMLLWQEGELILRSTPIPHFTLQVRM